MEASWLTYASSREDIASPVERWIGARDWGNIGRDRSLALCPQRAATRNLVLGFVSHFRVGSEIVSFERSSWVALKIRRKRQSPCMRDVNFMGMGVAPR